MQVFPMLLLPAAAVDAGARGARASFLLLLPPTAAAAAARASVALVLPCFAVASWIH